MYKEKLKEKINNKVNNLIDGVDLIGDINFFEINIRNVNGDVVYKLENNYKEKIK